MKIRFEFELKKSYAVVFAVLLGIFLVHYVGFFIHGYIPLRGVTAGGKQLYPTEEAFVYSLKYFSIEMIILLVVLAVKRSKKWVLVQLLIAPVAVYSSLLVAFPFRTIYFDQVAILAGTLFVLSLMVTFAARGVARLVKKFDINSDHNKQNSQ